jgi:hypothetical protein
MVTAIAADGSCKTRALEAALEAAAATTLEELAEAARQTG